LRSCATSCLSPDWGIESRKELCGVERGAFDTVSLQHVAMNIEDRAALYAEVHRILTSGGRFVSFEVGAS
jgi:ubiquinone/menaquinone biosynthesis C-methylase UbiE